MKQEEVEEKYLILRPLLSVPYVWSSPGICPSPAVLQDTLSADPAGAGCCIVPPAGDSWVITPVVLQRR